MRILGVIPARGGSKSVPKKNVVLLGGKPLIGYTIEAALAVQRFTDLVVSTDCEEIASVAREYGAAVPFVRPADLATDAALSLPVVQHATNEMERRTGAPYDIIVMLQPTTPFRTSQDIDDALDLLIEKECDSVVSLVEVGGHHPFRMKRLVGDRVINYIDQGFEDMRPRQALPPVYIRSGAIYANRRAAVMEQASLVGADCRGIVIDPERALNIDTMNDLRLAEIVLNEQNTK